MARATDEVARNLQTSGIIDCNRSCRRTSSQNESYGDPERNSGVNAGESRVSVFVTDGRSDRSPVSIIPLDEIQLFFVEAIKKCVRLRGFKDGN